MMTNGLGDLIQSIWLLKLKENLEEATLWYIEIVHMATFGCDMDCSIIPLMEFQRQDLEVQHVFHKAVDHSKLKISSPGHAPSINSIQCRIVRNA